MSQTVAEIISLFTHQKILVIGDAIADVYIKTVPGKICREAPVLVYDIQEQEYRCGGAANVAVNTACLGGETFFLTVTGNDAESEELIGELKQNDVRTE